jgi:prepilin-type N-terminal cleavage/methylation domain-containing protein
MRARRSSGFTLLELLVVVAIIAILATLILGGLASARRRAQIAVCRNNINAIKAALSAYETDVGYYPTAPNHAIATGNALFTNQITFAWAALHNRRALQFGGGPNSPYIEWKPEQVAHANYTTISNIAWGNGNSDPSGALPAPPQLQATGAGGLIDQTEFDGVMSNDINYFTSAPGMGTVGPQGSGALVFCDPWGNPFVYVEWADIPQQQKDNLSMSMPVSGTGGNATLKPHDPSKFDIWSFGPNGVNEGGTGDDITSWSTTTTN